MSDNPTVRWPRAAMTPWRRHRIPGRFSVCLFVVLLAVCGWTMHRRLSQYDTPQQAVHQSTAIKVCLTKRNPISVRSMRGTEAFAVFLLATALLTPLGSPGNPEAAQVFRVQGDGSDRRAAMRMRPSLIHFFFLPPPSHFPVL